MKFKLMFQNGVSCKINSK